MKLVYSRGQSLSQLRVICTEGADNKAVAHESERPDHLAARAFSFREEGTRKEKPLLVQHIAGRQGHLEQHVRENQVLLERTFLVHWTATGCMQLSALAELGASCSSLALAQAPSPISLDTLYQSNQRHSETPTPFQPRTTPAARCGCPCAANMQP